MTSSRRTDRADWGALGIWGAAIVAVGCCAGGPLIAGLLGSLAVGSVLGLGAALVAIVAVAIVVASRYRRTHRDHGTDVRGSGA